LRVLEPLRSHRLVGDVRGRGLLAGVELVKDQATREPFPQQAQMAERVRQAALDRGVTSYPIQGCVDGERGDLILLAPPFIITFDEIGEIGRVLAAAVEQVARA